MAKKKKVEGKSKIHEPLSPFHPSPFKVGEPTLQNFVPEYHGDGAVYVKNDEYPEKPEETD